jgi:hypothetical protein
MGGCATKEVAYTVRLAGCSRVNGVYVQESIYCDRPSLTNKESGLKLWYNEGEWRLGNRLDYFYVNKDDGPTPPLQGWIVADTHCNKDASSPAPTVTKKFCKCC